MLNLLRLCARCLLRCVAFAELLAGSKAAAALVAAGMAKTTSAHERSRRIAATHAAQTHDLEQQALDAELAEMQCQLEKEWVRR